MAQKSLFSPQGFSVGNLFNPTDVILANADITAGNAVSANYFIGNGALLTGISVGSDYGNANVANYLASNANVTITVGVANITTQGNITAGYFLGNATFAEGVSNTYFGNVAPSSPAQGDIWIDSDTGIQTIYFVDANGGQWAEMEASKAFSVNNSSTVITANLTYSNTAPANAAVGDMWITANTAKQFVYFNDGTSNIWAEMEAYQTFSSTGTTYGNGNLVAYGEQGWAGNIIPSTSNIYNLGSANYQWNSLYVASNTIYFNNVPVSVSNSGLTVNGSPTVTSNAARYVFVSTSAPTSGQGNVGDIWYQTY